MKVLIIIDMQYDFIDGSLGTPEAQKIVPNVVNKIKNEDKDTIVIFTKDTHYADYLKTQEGERLPVPHCIRETDGWQIHSDVRDAWLAKEDRFVVSQEVFDIEENNIIEKETFGSLKLGELLTKMDMFSVEIDEVEICGLCTDICVISNAMIVKNCLPETTITIDSSCCAGTTPEGHKTALDAMKACQINVIGE